ncbi:hypothetical protein KSP40_PGU010706 [Platanthera guangdongensis]|uniref:Uncharacterized protein n=1 Tax=Platanthera guangdongensis TaxID=2320717 RepID=A0ABR2MUR3_9ASPA
MQPYTLDFQFKEETSSTTKGGESTGGGAASCARTSRSGEAAGGRRGDGRRRGAARARPSTEADPPRCASATVDSYGGTAAASPNIDPVAPVRRRRHGRKIGRKP